MTVVPISTIVERTIIFIFGYQFQETVECTIMFIYMLRASQTLIPSLNCKASRTYDISIFIGNIVESKLE